MTPLLLTVIALLAAAVIPTTARAAVEAVTYQWPVSPIVSGDDPTMGVTVTGHDGPRQVLLSEWIGNSEVLLDEVVLDTAATSVTLQFPALTAETVTEREFTVEVRDAGTGAYIDDDHHTLTITPPPGTFTDLNLPGGTYKARQKAQITGVVAEAPGRVVLVQARTANGWVDLDRTTTDETGRFALPAPTWWVNKTAIRAVALGLGGFATFASDATTLKVKRTYKPRAGTSYARVNSKARWNPCHVVTYRVNPKRIPGGGMAALKEAFRRVSEASGLRFHYAGKTNFVPWHRDNSPWDQIDNADFAVAWANEKIVPDLGGGTIGRGGGYAVETSGGYKMEFGFIVLDTQPRIASGFKGGRATMGSLLMHEIGHAVGLDHANDRRQIMYPSMTGAAAQFAKGDLAGMRAVGARQGCFGGSSYSGAADSARSASPKRISFHAADHLGDE